MKLGIKRGQLLQLNNEEHVERYTKLVEEQMEMMEIRRMVWNVIEEG